jgi:hypothetical protein
LRLGRLLFFGWCFGSIAGGCTSDLELQLEGLRCNGQNRCSKGYACNKYTRECVRNDAGPPAEGGSSAGGVGHPTGGASSWHGGAGGNGGVAGTSDIGGQGGVDSGGAGGSEDDFDAGPPELVDGGPDGCVPTTLFRDDDRDTYGVVAGPGYGCPQRGWATRAGDCRDDLAIVHPDQDRFFGEGFVDQTKPGNISFDYDCSNLEEPSPNNNDNAVPPDVCPALGLTCQGSGFLAANSPPRTGSGADQRCGSVMRRNCQVEGILGCTAVDTPVADFLRFLCH